MKNFPDFVRGWGINGFYNHSQVEDSELTFEESWRKRVKPAKGNFLGMSTRLGHAYSILIEEMQRELGEYPSKQKFLGEIAKRLRKVARYDIAQNLSFDSPCLEMDEGRHFLEVLFRTRLKDETCERIVLEVFGVDSGLNEKISEIRSRYRR